MQPIDLTGLTTYDLASRPSKVQLQDLGKPVLGSASMVQFLDSLPMQFGAVELRKVRDHIVRCHQANYPVAAAIGGHVIKVGCAPYLIDWMAKGILKSLSMNGSAAIHDFELALAGKTSEDVAAQLPGGKFGMARETAEAFAVAARKGAQGIGLGAALGDYIDDIGCPHAEISVVRAARKYGVPCTIHVALGTDIVHMHPQVSGAELGEASLIDFRILCNIIRGMQEGVWLNIGSAVIMPEVFLKAIAVARNFGADLGGLVTVNLDKEAKYRTRMNVLSRPSAQGIEIIGHHEILIPLLHAAVVANKASSPLRECRPMSNDLIELVQGLGRPRVLVVGDVMLDRYVWGDAERISQEAPVILLRADRREERLGGASSVATMLSALGAEVSLAGVVGNDPDGSRVQQILSDLHIETAGVGRDSSRPTTVKERYIGRAQHKHPQQMLRVDYEVRDALHGEVETTICNWITQQIRNSDIVLVSDYDKGVCTPMVMETTIREAKKQGIRVIADPIRGSDYRKYRGCSAMTPNRLEAGLATKRTIQTLEDAFASARELRDTLELEAGIVTLDKDGMAMCHRDGTTQLYPTRPRQVYDITGAGDMVMSVLGLALAAGADYPAAIRLANVAGGLEVEKIGVATVTREEILHDLIHASHLTHEFTPAANKLRSLPQLVQDLETRRRHGQKIAFTNGCFDVLHAGHVQYLNEARAQADLLVVGLNSDSSIRNLKGPTRPVNPVEARIQVLAGLQAVDYVTVFQEATPIELIQAVKPDVLVKGADYRKEDVVGGEFVESYGGRVHLAGLREGFSTTHMIQRMRVA